MEKTEKTAKAKRTREHILATALRLFEEKGYQETTLREIAKSADVSLGLTYRYFASKDELVLALYERLSDETVEQSKSLDGGTMASRFGITLNRCLDGLTPHRNALGSLFSVGLNATSELSVLGSRSSGVRRVMWGLYRDVASGASDAPKSTQVDSIATILYASHLLTILFWLQDQSEDQRRTRDLIKFAEGLLKRMRPIMGLPMFTRSMRELGQIIGPMFGPGENLPSGS